LNQPVNLIVGDVIFTVSKGENASRVARNLYKENLIKSPLDFYLAVKLNNLEYQLKYGDYKIHGQMSTMDIAYLICSGKKWSQTITIPEGYRLEQIASLLKQISPELGAEFLMKVKDAQFIESLGLFGISSLEGFLFPDTYTIERDINADRFILLMYQRFKDICKEIGLDLLKEKIEIRPNIALSPVQIIIMASIIEKETYIKDERELVASVLYNRLANKMRLQACPTVRYALQKWSEPLLVSDLKVDSPYNTYLYKGLPPNPICNPGKESLIASLHPKDTNLIYFVAVENGKHFFTDSYKEHIKMKQKKKIIDK